MTKSQTFYYVAAVVIITLLVYLYTAIGNSPVLEESVPEQNNEVLESIDNVENTLPTTTSPVITGNTNITNPNEVTENYLINTTWRWVGTTQFSGTDELVTKPKNENAFILTFSDNNTMSSQTDCNNIGGTYTISNNSLTFGSMMSTLMYCEGSQESEYVAQLAKVQSIFLDADSLELGIENGKMLFVRVTE